MADSSGKTSFCGVTWGPGCGLGCGEGSCAEAACGGYEETGDLRFVGQGRGEYRAETSYTYVGKGAGDVEMVMRPKSNYCYCYFLIPLLILLLLMLMRMVSSETTTTTLYIQPPLLSDEAPPQTKSCTIYGDPHAMTFDGLHSDYYTSGEFWIVKSSSVMIQGKYSPTHATNGLAVTKQIAVGGSLLKNHILIVGEEHATWDGQQILLSFPSKFDDPEGLVSIEYNNVGQLLQPGREGRGLHVLHITLPGDVMLQVNRWNEPGEGRYINTKITMPHQEGQDGQCGNYNGVAADDARLEVKSRLGKNGVAVEDLMFPGEKTVINQDLEDCPDTTLVSAHEECKKVSDNFWPHMSCLVSVCHGGEAVPKVADAAETEVAQVQQVV